MNQPCKSAPAVKLKSRLILASASPRRKHLLEQAGLVFEVMPSRVDENAAGAAVPESYVRRLAEAKAAAVSCRYPDAYVIGADTIVVIDGRILGKPDSKSEARDMLKKLSGRTHRVLTGFALKCDHGGYFHSETIQTDVHFKTLTAGEIEWYLETKEPFDKAGGYGIQGRGAFMIKRIAGSYTNVVGLPMSEMIDCLARIGLTGHVTEY